MSPPRDRAAWQAACDTAEAFRQRVIAQGLSGQALTAALAETLYAQDERWRLSQGVRDKSTARAVARGLGDAVARSVTAAVDAYVRSLGP